MSIGIFKLIKNDAKNFGDFKKQILIFLGFQNEIQKV